MPRTLWKGAISFGLVHIPVSLQHASQDRGLDLTMLDRRNMRPVGYQRINKESGELVPYDDIVKGYEYEKDQYVVLTDEDFKRANVKATQTVDIVNFVETGTIPQIYMETPYYLVPDRGGEKSYALLREALRQTHKVGIAYVVIRTKQRLAALFPMEDVLVLNTLRYADEIKPISSLEFPHKDLKDLRVSPKEIEMATRLVEEMAENWKPEKYHDSYREDILARVEQKVNTRQTHTIPEPSDSDETQPSAEVIDLVSLLKRSIQTKGKPDARMEAHAGARAESGAGVRKSRSAASARGKSKRRPA
jgi:DNA end-binding protein Ku